MYNSCLIQLLFTKKNNFFTKFSSNFELSIKFTQIKKVRFIDVIIPLRSVSTNVSNCIVLNFMYTKFQVSSSKKWQSYWYSNMVHLLLITLYISWYLLSIWSEEFDSPFLLVSMINPWQCYACRDEYTHFPYSTSQMVCSRGDSAQLLRSLWTIMPLIMWRHKCSWNSWLFWTQELMNSMMFFAINRGYVWAISSENPTSSIDTLKLTDQLWLILLVSVWVLQVRYLTSDENWFWF